MVEPVSADLFLILPSYVCKPTLATTDIFHLGVFVFVFVFYFGCIMFVAACRLSLVSKNGGYLLFVVCRLLIAMASLVKQGC